MPILFNPSIGQDALPQTPQQKKQAVEPPRVGGSQTTQQPPAPKSEFSIPNSSVYLNETNAANMAFEKAKSQLLANRNSLYHQYGLTDSGAVDVNNPYGQYQALLGAEGAALDSTHNDAIARGLGTGGLANQAEAALIPQQRADQLNFQRMVDQAGLDYSLGLNEAQDTKSASYNTAYQDALQDALARGLFDIAPPSAPTTTVTTPTGAKTTVAKALPALFRPTAVKVTANKTGASRNKKQGIFSIH